MKVKIIVARNRFPTVGQVIDIEKSQAQHLIDVGLAVLADKKTEKKQQKTIIKEDK